MASWGYIAVGFGMTAVAIGGYVARLERRIARLRGQGGEREAAR